MNVRGYVWGARLLWLAVGVVIAASTLAGAELRMVYSFTEERVTTMQAAKPQQANPTAAATTATGKGEPRTERHAGELVVALGGDYFLIERDGVGTSYDFKARRILSQAAGRHEWTEISLFSDLGFRVMEYQNRVMLGQVLSASGLKDPSVTGMGDTFELETLFCLRFPNERGKPVVGLKKETLENGAWSFRKDGKEVVLFKPSASAVPEKFRAVFERWLVYACRIHPDIRREIVASGRVPQTLLTHWKNTGEGDTSSLELKSFVESEDTVVIPAAEHVALPAAEGPLRELVELSRDPKRRAERPTTDSLKRFADDAMASGRVLDGFLALLEITFQNGGDIAADFRRNRDRISQDEGCKRFFEGMAQSDKASCEHAVQVLRAIDRKQLKKDYIVDIHLADALSTLDRGAEAEIVFFSVLHRNPFLVGVWNDLGQQYYRGYEMGKAWLCWDTARAISPGHPMLRSITEMERRFEADFPEFFLASANSVASR